MMAARLRSSYLPMLVCFLSLQAAAQEINFSDLKREGKPILKHYSVPGTASEGRDYVLKFDGVDTARVKAWRAYASSHASSSSGSSSDNSAKASSSSAKPMKTFVCTIYCNTSGGPTITREMQAGNRSEAAKYMGDNADQICQNTGFRKASSAYFPDNQCRER